MKTEETVTQRQLISFDSSMTIGQRQKNEQINGADPFLVDLFTITNSPLYKRLVDKTQVFNPRLPVMNRLTHSNQVSSFAQMVASSLHLNTFLVQASAHLHDVGHTPYGHLGERTISEISGHKFRHDIMGVNLAQKIMPTLHYETLLGVALHSRGNGGVIDVADSGNINCHNLLMYSDKIAYTFSDISDAIRVSFLPKKMVHDNFWLLDANQCMTAMISESKERGFVSFSQSKEAKMHAELREWSFQEIYFRLDRSEERLAAGEELKKIYLFLEGNREFLGFEPLTAIAIMQDQEARDLVGMIPTFCIRDVEKIKLTAWARLYEKIAGVNLFRLDLDEKEYRRFD